MGLFTEEAEPTHAGWSEFDSKDSVIRGIFTRPPDYKADQNRVFSYYYGKRMRTALIVDVHSLYMGCNRKYPGKTLNYADLLSSIVLDGNILFVKSAYGRQPEENVPQFAKVLRRLGFDLKFGSGPHNVAMAIEALQLVCSVDHLVLATNYHELAGITAAVRRQGVYTSVWGFDVPKVFENTAIVNEIPESLTQLVN